MKRAPLLAPLALLGALCTAPAAADEGLWPLNRLPATLDAPDAALLDRLRGSAVRLVDGCSGSFVSPQGLVLTNAHCVTDCVAALSAQRRRDFARDGFLARRPADEGRCPGAELGVLQSIRDVSAEVAQATEGVAPAQFAQARQAAVAAIERDCARPGADGETPRCEVVPLWRGARHDLYVYQRIADVRLVFAPEDDIAFFGGDADNFEFPRYNLDMAVLRAYGRDGRPLATPVHLRPALPPPRGLSMRPTPRPPQEGDRAYVVGHPGGTSRGFSLAQLRAERDLLGPLRLARLSELRGLLQQYAERDAESRRHSKELLDNVENGLKVAHGTQAALADPAFFATLEARETALRRAVAARPDWQRQWGGLWDAMEAVVARERALAPRRAAFQGAPSLLTVAAALVRHADETARPDAERLEAYTEARLPELRRRVLAPVPVHEALEITLLARHLARLREALGADDPLVRRLFASKSPAQWAAEAVRGTRLKTQRVAPDGRVTGGLRLALLDGGRAAVAASRDPMVELARLIDPAALELRRRWEAEVEGPRARLEALLAQARFAVEGEAGYPDATFTLRLSLGTLRGWTEPDGRAVPTFTTFGGLFERASGVAPFALPRSWRAARSRLDPDTPFNLSSDHDIIGGNSGSPLVDREGALIGLVFDGNRHSHGGEFGFDARLNRAVSLDWRAIEAALERVYGAHELLAELR